MAAILILTPQIPYPPRQGTALRNWGLLRGLSKHHEISLLTFASPDQELAPEALLERCTERVAIIPQPARSLRHRLWDLIVTGWPDLCQRLASAAFGEQLEAWLSRYHFDWILVEGLELAPYLTSLPEVKASAEDASAADVPAADVPKIIFDDHNCEYVLQRRAARADFGCPKRWPGALYSSVQWRRLRRYEAQVCDRSDLVVAVSEADAAALRAIVPDLDPLVISNGIDVAAYAGFEASADLSQPAFVFTGTMDFRPNVDGVLWCANHVWPRIRERLPGAHFYIVGRHPHARLERLREAPGIVITGSVPETQPYIRAAAVTVVPLLVGGGTRLKLLESTAMGKAIVATRLAAEGFAAPERAMVLADTPAEFADACVRLVQNEGERATWSARAQAFAGAYDWDVLLPALLKRLEG